MLTYADSGMAGLRGHQRHHRCRRLHHPGDAIVTNYGAQSGPLARMVPARGGPGHHGRVHRLMPIEPPMAPGGPFVPKRSTTPALKPILALCCGPLTFGQSLRA